MARHCRRSALLLAFALLSLTPLQAPAADWPVPRGPSHEPEPYRYDPADAKRLPRAFLEDAPACILYSGSSYLVEGDGTIETITHEITRFSGRKGIDKLGEYRNITYNPSYQTLTLNEARVHKADGRVVAIEPRHVQLRDLSTDYLIYDRDKQLVISFPNLEVGDTIEVKWATRGKNPEHQGQFFTRYNFGDDTFPVARDELRVRLPRGRELKYGAIGGTLDPVVRDDGDRRLYTWRAVNRPQLPQDDYLPPKEDLRLQVACSTFASWEDVGRWKQQLRSDCWECDAEVRKVVEEVTRGLKAPVDKARALTYWVRRHIRYVSAGEKHDFTPNAPSQVFANRYGDCKDQSQLLAVMLRQAGLPVALATLGVLDDGQVLEAVPSPWGTHAILLLTLDGRDHWIDTTVSLAAWDHLPREDRDRLCYVFDADPAPGKPLLRLVRTPPVRPADNRVEQTTRLTVGADGSARGERSSVYYGSAATAQRESWVDVPPGERRRLVTAELQDAQSHSRLSRLEVDEKRLQDFDQPVAARVAYEVVGHFSGDADREGSLTDNRIWSKLLALNLDYDRQAPLDLGAPFESRHRYEVRLPPAYFLDSVPREHTVRSPWGAFTLKVEADDKDPRKLAVEFDTRLEKTRVEPADFEAFRKFHDDLTKHYRAWLVLKPAQDKEDAAALEALLALAPDDGNSAAVLARLYQQHGQAKDARRVLQRACAYRPNDAALWELAVKLAENLEEEESLYRELIRRFPDEPRYAVAYGAVLVRRGRHAEAKAVLEPVADKGAPAQRALALYQLARSSLQQNQAAQALQSFEDAAKADPDSVHTAAALSFKGTVHEKLGQAKEAIAAYQQALLLDADAKDPLLALVRLEWAAKDAAAALDHLRHYTLAVGEDAEGLQTAAEWHLRLKRYEDAQELAARVPKDERSPKGRRVLGLVALHRNDYEKAVEQLKDSATDAQALDGLLRGLVALGRIGEAEAAAARADKAGKPTQALRKTLTGVKDLARRSKALQTEARVPPGKEEAVRKASEQLACAEQAHADGRPAARVESLLSGAFTGDVELGPACALRGLLALERGRLSRALADADKAVSLSPKEARGYYVRGRVRLERGAAGALADLEKAAELSGRKDAAVLHWLAAALGQAGRPEEALTAQREAVKLKPGDGELVEQLRRFEGQSSRGGGP
jgi:tetratricopeptide (TPR) repeat protein